MDWHLIVSAAQSESQYAIIVRATAEQLSRDLAGDPKHIYKHKIRQEGTPSRGSVRATADDLVEI